MLAASRVVRPFTISRQAETDVRGLIKLVRGEWGMGGPPSLRSAPNHVAPACAQQRVAALCCPPQPLL